LAYGLGIVQLLGGAALALGLLTRPIALLFAIEMIFSVILHYPHGYTFAAPGGGYEFPADHAADLYRHLLPRGRALFT
jgi:uncharacterized membrane protein YphA (DoxX/SURF4 family)